MQEVHLRAPLDLLLSPFCAMQPAHDHPTFKWPRQAAERFAASAAAVSQMHAAKLGLTVVACHHTGACHQGISSFAPRQNVRYLGLEAVSADRNQCTTGEAPLRPAGAWSAALPRLLPCLRADAVPLSGPMLGCSAIYAPGGAPLVRLDREEEGMALVQLPLLQGARSVAAAAPRGGQLMGTNLAGVLGAAAVASADAGPAAPYAAYSGGYVVEPVSWEVKVRRNWQAFFAPGKTYASSTGRGNAIPGHLKKFATAHCNSLVSCTSKGHAPFSLRPPQFGFRLMEALGALSYSVWQGGLRRHVAHRIAADGVWRGPLPPLDARTGSGWSLAVAAAAGMVLATLLLRHTKT